MIQSPRFFLAHAKSASAEDLERYVHDCSAILDRLAQGQTYDLVLARAYWEARFKACGSWAAWCAEVASGMDPATRNPLFRAIMVPLGPVGAATAKIVEGALVAHRHVILFDGQDARRVTRISCLDPKDWKGGWKVE